MLSGFESSLTGCALNKHYVAMACLQSKLVTLKKVQKSIETSSNDLRSSSSEWWRHKNEYDVIVMHQVCDKLIICANARLDSRKQNSNSLPSFGDNGIGDFH